MGLTIYVNECKNWCKGGQHMLDSSQQEIEKQLKIHHSLHRKKLRLALEGNAYIYIVECWVVDCLFFTNYTYNSFIYVVLFLTTSIGYLHYIASKSNYISGQDFTFNNLLLQLPTY